MAKSIPHQQIPIARGKRYSLRTLFFVSALFALPLLVLANWRHSVRPEESVASPLYLLLGIAGVVVAAAAGSAMGNKAGMFAAACLAACSWIALVVLCGVFSSELQTVLPVHAMFAIATVAVLAVVVWSGQKPEKEGPHNMLLRLLSVKHDVREAQQAKHVDSNPAESEIRNPKSEI